MLTLCDLCHNNTVRKNISRERLVLGKLACDRLASSAYITKPARSDDFPDAFCYAADIQPTKQ